MYIDWNGIRILKHCLGGKPPPKNVNKAEIIEKKETASCDK